MQKIPACKVRQTEDIMNWYRLFILLLPLLSSGTITFEKTYGGISYDMGYCVKNAPDKSFIMVSFIDVRNLSSGIYFAVLKQGNELVSKKFLKIK
ncbi:MAG: T9SS type A sorting domain-containing protein [bacterium]